MIGWVFNALVCYIVSVRFWFPDNILHPRLVVSIVNVMIFRAYLFSTKDFFTGVGKATISVFFWMNIDNKIRL